MNKTNIDWPGLTHSWNPITGCIHGCPYCYAKVVSNTRLKDDFMPKLHEHRLTDKDLSNKTPLKIFVGSMADMWGNWVSEQWILKVEVAINRHPQHTFMFLTKNPSRYYGRRFKENVIIGTTVTGENADADNKRLGTLAVCEHNRKFISIEPLLGPVSDLKVLMDGMESIEHVIVGAMTGAKAVKPQKRWLEDVALLPLLYKGKVHFKKNIGNYEVNGKKLYEFNTGRQ